VQFKALTLPAISAKGYRGRTTVTPYMRVKNKDALRRVCERLPRLLDVIMVAFESDPVHLSDRQNDLAARQKDLGKRIEASIGAGVFDGFYIVQGTRRRGEGTELIRVPGGSPACQPIKYLPWEAPPPKEILDAANDLGGQSRTATPGAAAKTETAVEAEPQPLPRKPFPPPPMAKPERLPSWVFIFIALVGMGGVMLVIGSYIGYQVAKIKRDRRRRERRLNKKKDRRSGIERRQRDDGPPDGIERRSGKDRRSGIDRRAQRERRDDTDRREAAETHAPTDAPVPSDAADPDDETETLQQRVDPRRADRDSEE